MIKIYSYVSQLSYDVSDEEKMAAEKALLYFDYASKALSMATDHLDIMGIPFKDHPDIKPDELIKYRAALRRYRDKVIENFNSFKLIAFKCINAMQPFSSDTQTSKLMKTFISSIDSIEDKVNNFSELFDKLESSSFIQDVNKAILDIHNLCDELEEIIDDRIKGHLKSNIIGKTWLDNFIKNKNIKLDDRPQSMRDLL